MPVLAASDDDSRAVLNAYHRILALSSTFFGIFLFLNFAAIALLLYNGLRRRTSEQAQFACLVFLLGTTTVYYGFLVEDVHLLIPLGPIGEFWDYTPRIFSQQGVVAIMLTLNIFTSNWIVWWRACVAWKKNKVVLYVGAFLHIVVLVCGFATTGPFFQDWKALPPQVALEYMYTNYGPGPSAFGLSMGINVTAAILVGIKAWAHRGDLRKQLGSRGPRAQATVIFALLVECGALYGAFWLAVLIPNVLEYKYLTMHTFSLRGTIVFTNGCVAPIAASYAVLVILLVGYNTWRVEHGQSMFLVTAILSDSSGARSIKSQPELDGIQA